MEVHMKNKNPACLSSEKREDIWAIILALVVLLLSILAQDFYMTSSRNTFS